MEIVIHIVVGTIILPVVTTSLGSESGGGSASDFDTKDPGNID